jgi:TolA-binding protein
LAADKIGADADRAIRLYREVVATPSGERVYAAFAQFRIAKLLLQKGNVTAAAAELAKLAQEYPDSKDLVGTMVAEDWIKCPR